MVIPKRHRRAGFSLVELVLTIALTTVFLVGLAGAVQRSVGLHRQTSSSLQLQRRAENSAQRIRTELMNAGGSTLSPIPTVVPGAPTPWSDFLEFRSVTRWDMVDVEFGTLTSLSSRLEAAEIDDGVDQDGDGLIDEHELILTLDAGGPNERVVVLERGLLEWFPGETPDGTDENGNGLVDEAGLCFVLDGNTVTVRIAVGEHRPDGTIGVRTRSISMTLHN